MTQPRVRANIRAFLNLIENGSAQAEHKLEVLLDQLACARHEIAKVMDAGEDPDLPKKDYDETLALVKTQFAGFGYYNVSEILGDMHEPGSLVGDAGSDVVHIYTELDAVEQLWRSQGEKKALGHFAATFDLHWGGHLRWLQVYLLELRRG